MPIQVYSEIAPFAVCAAPARQELEHLVPGSLGGCF